MQQNILKNQFQSYMEAKFFEALSSASAIMSNVRGKENLVYEYINKMGACIQQPKYDMHGNPNGLYADYALFKRDFVGYWRRALGLSIADTQQLEVIFDNAVISQEQCKKLATISLYFENGSALTVDDCLTAIYDVMELV